MELIEFYVTVDQDQVDMFKQYCASLQSGRGHTRVSIVNEFDASYASYTFVLRGSWLAYKHFKEHINTLSFVNDVEQFEE